MYRMFYYVLYRKLEEQNMKNKVMAIVEKICNTESISCRGLDKSNFARELMNLANIPQNADIQEIPVNWDNMAAINFLIPDDDRYFCLFAGIGIDGNYHFELSIIGTLLENGYFHFRQEDGLSDLIIPIDYFTRKTIIMEEIKNFIEITAKKAASECPEMTMEQYKTEYTSQILDNDFYNVVNWANWKGVQVPEELKWIIDPEF